MDIETIDRLRKSARDVGGDHNHLLACRRVKVRDIPKGLLPQKYFDALEQNQKIASCCRHPEDHDIAAFYSSPNEIKTTPQETAPDVYIMFCKCGKKHRRLCVGQGVPGDPNRQERRPFWD